MCLSPLRNLGEQRRVSKPVICTFPNHCICREVVSDDTLHLDSVVASLPAMMVRSSGGLIMILTEFLLQFKR